MVPDTQKDVPEPEKAVEFQRLPKNVVPVRYELFIELDFKTGTTFNGITSLYAQVLEETNLVQLNAVNLEILEVSCEQVVGTGGEKRNFPASSTSLDKETQILSIRFETALSPGEVSFNILYTGRVAETKKGFFRSRYTSHDGEERYAFATHFEPDMARSCFPCMDEPALKATFQLSLVVPKNRIGLSNMPVLEETDYEENHHYKIMKFESTPIMSTYLAAFAIGEFDFLEELTKNGVRVRAYTPVGRKSLGEFGLYVAAKSLDFYEDYFGVAYPLPKLDLVPLAEFSSGAMENWGMITFREERLVVDAKQTSAMSKQCVALVVAHEVSHQWFGNLVTMEWWTELWLNEGYATFVEFLSVAHLFPEYDIWNQFATDVLIPALVLDSLSSSHPVEVEIKSPADSSEVFDTISYCKGASIIRMLQTYMGDEKFRAGMKDYLTTFQYKNARTIDLWEALERTSGMPVSKVMANWTSQVGFPLVKIAEVTQIGTGRAFTLTQEKFCADAKHSGNKMEFEDHKWLIPLSLTQATQSDKPSFHALFDGGESKLIDILVPDVAPGEWIKFNAGLTGFYRVHYPSEMLKEFLPAIRGKTMSPLDRLGLLDDLFAVVQCGEADTTEVLSLLKAYAEEDDYTVWSAIQTVVSTLQKLLGFTEFSNSFQTFVGTLFGPLKERLGWEAQDGESHLTGLLRSVALLRLVSIGDEKTVAEAKERFELHVKKDVLLPADIRAPVYRAVLVSSDPSSAFDSLVQLYRDSDLSEEKVRILRALGTVKDEGLMDRILQFSLTDEVKAQDILSILYNMATSKVGMRRAWDFFKNNVEIFKTKFVGQALSRFVKALVEGFASEEVAVEVEEFFKLSPVKGTTRSVQQGVESIRNNAAWLHRDSKSIQNYLSSPCYTDFTVL